MISTRLRPFHLLLHDQIGAVGFRALAHALEEGALPRLKTLNLAGNVLGEAALTELHDACDSRGVALHLTSAQAKQTEELLGLTSAQGGLLRRASSSAMSSASLSERGWRDLDSPRRGSARGP